MLFTESVKYIKEWYLLFTGYVINMTTKRKFIGDIPEEEMKIIESACEIEKRTKISLIRKASVDYAKKILQNATNTAHN